jgi:hypothetical protein
MILMGRENEKNDEFSSRHSEKSNDILYERPHTNRISLIFNH